MATIPIEVIVQDKASPEPTPTPSDSGETNIVVPDTGAGIVENGSNGGGIGSAVSIILPAIILVLAIGAIGAIVAIMVHRYQKRKKVNDGIKEYDTKESKRTVNRKEKLATVASGTIAILAATVLVGNLVTPATKAATSVEPGTAELDTVDKITITATREIDSDIVVATVKNTSYATANLDFGYKVTASMIEGATTANLYLNGDETSEYYIAPVENKNKENENIEDENTAGNAELANNTWGYTLEEPSEGTTYLPIPLEETPATITKGNDMVEDEAVDIYYTIKVDKDMPAGSYMGELEYNISPAVEYMQDFATMTEEEKTATLANMPEGEQYILKDIRDKKPYYISKLADGNVWMTQNLDHDIVSTSDFYTSANTDLPSGITWTGTATKVTGDTSWVNLTTAPESYDPGSLYWNGAIIYDQATCEEYGGTWKPWGSCDDAKTTSSAGDDYYYLGNYYNWTAAVAMSDSSAYTTDQQDVNQSICPAGWRLPTYSGGKSYQNLVGTLSITSGVDGNIQNSPVYFVYGGNWYGRFGDMSESGSYWLSVSYDSGASYVLSFDASGSLYSQGLNGRSTGYLVRCVAR